MKMKLSLWSVGILLVLSVIVLGIVDWVTGYELNFYVFYFLPVAAAAWFFGLIGAVVIALLSTMVWFGADLLTGHIHVSTAHAVWNTMIRLVSFLVIGWVIVRLRQLLYHEREIAEALRRSISEIKVLEAFLPICAQCKKIRNEQNVWQPLEVYITHHSNTQFSHGYCPDCGKQAMREAGFLDEDDPG